MFSSPLRLATVVLLASTLSACQCGTDQTGRVYAQPELVFPGADGEIVSRDNALYDFGPVFMGQTVSSESAEGSKLRIRNAGNALLTLKSVEVQEGGRVGFDSALAEASIFNLAFPVGATVEAGGELKLPLLFRPPQAADPTVESQEHEAKITLLFEGARDAESIGTLTVKGRGVSGVCDVDRVVDFGAVKKNDTFRKSIRLRNPAKIPAKVTLGDPYSSTGDHQAFTFSSGPPEGHSITLLPQSEQELFLDFRPTTNKPYVAFLKVRASEQCPDVVISLEGEGVDQVLTWEPALVDCSFAPIGYEVRREVTFTNAGITPVTVAQFTASSPEFSVIIDAVFNGTQFTVPSREQVKLTVACKPQLLGLRTGTLSFATSLLTQPSGQLGMRVLGGGPDIDVKPSTTLNFGQVAFFPSAIPAIFQTRRITASNVGTRPNANDDSANLKLGKAAGLAGDRVAPFAEVKPTNANTDPAEFSILVSPTYDPVLGLRAIAGQNWIDFTVKFTPRSLGAKSAEITIPSNDPDEPVTTITVSATVVTMAPCSYAVSPSNLNFGLVSAPSYRDLPVTITNTGTNDCLLSNLDFAADTHPTYSLPGGAISSTVLTSGQSLTVKVRTHPQIPPEQSIKTLNGKLLFYMSSPTQPQGAVQLATTLLAPCLTVAPDDLNFGTVKQACDSATRTFTVYNSCSVPVTLNSISVSSPAGFPANTPVLCPGTSSCPEFLYTGASVNLPVTMPAGSSSITFTAKYRPLNLGADQGAIALSVTQGGQAVVYLVTLAGNGDATGENTDLFEQDANPKADILLTIDNSCSMAPYQSSLAQNFAAFMTYANQQGVDYQMAVTTTDNGPGGEQGRMVTGPNHPDRILTPTSPNVMSQFKAKVAVGVMGSGTETGLAPSLKALTAPLIATTNQGFLRDGANLGIVVVTDALDQSPGTAAFYVSAFTNIKGAQRANSFSFSAVAGFQPTPPSSCAGYDTGPDDGKYAYVVNATRGVKEEICTQNWAVTLGSLGKTLFGYRTSFFLTAQPDFSGTNTLEVRLNGVLLPASELGVTAWTYDAATNSVNFEPAYVPEPGDTLAIHYFVSCYL